MLAMSLHHKHGPFLTDSQGVKTTPTTTEVAKAAAASEGAQEKCKEAREIADRDPHHAVRPRLGVWCGSILSS